MSALGQKQTLHWSNAMSALPPKADIGGDGCDVRFVPKADIAPKVKIKLKARPPKVADDTSFDARFTAAWTGATNVLGPPVIQSTECSYAGVVLNN